MEGKKIIDEKLERRKFGCLVEGRKRYGKKNGRKKVLIVENFEKKVLIIENSLFLLYIEIKIISIYLLILT